MYMSEPLCLATAFMSQVSEGQKNLLKGTEQLSWDLNLACRVPGLCILTSCTKLFVILGVGEAPALCWLSVGRWVAGEAFSLSKIRDLARTWALLVHGPDSNLVIRVGGTWKAPLKTYAQTSVSPLMVGAFMSRLSELQKDSSFCTDFRSCQTPEA